MKETQGIAGGLGGGDIKAAEASVSAVKNASSQIRQTVAQTERENIRNFEARIRVVDAGEKATVKAREDAIKATEAASLHSFTQRIRQIDQQQQAEVKAAKTIVATTAQIAATPKFDSTAFWARQGAAATHAAQTTTKAWTLADTAQARIASETVLRDEQVLARKIASSAKATSTVIRDTKTGATITQAELAKIISGGSRVVENEAKKVGVATGGILNSLRKLFLQNNFLFRQLGQRIGGDLGFIGVGAGKLALNFEQLVASSGGVAAELETLAGSAVGTIGVLGPLGLAIAAVAAGFVAIEVAGAAAAFGLFTVAKSVSDTEEHFDDLSRQTGLSTDNLQALDIVSRQSGSNIDKLTNSVGQLQRKLIDASEGGTSRLSVGLKKLGIDLDDPNRALSQLTDLLIKLPAGTVRTGAAMQIFGRGGRDVAGVMDQIAENVGTADGALDRLKKQLMDAGVHIDKDGTQTAGRFHDQLILLEAQFESVKRVVGEEALPFVLDAATKFSDWIGRNRVQVAAWSRELEHAAEDIAEVALQLTKVIALTALPLIVELRFLPRVLEGPGIGIAHMLGEAIGTKGPPPDSVLARRTFTQDREGQKAADDAAKRIRDAFAPKGRGGGKGEDPAQTARRLAEISLQETLKGLQAEHDALQRSLDLNFIAREKYTQDAVNLELKRREATIAGLRAELKAADDIRKPGQWAVKVAEINARIRDEERRTAKEITQIVDDRDAEQLRIGQSTAQSQLRIVETQTEQVKARIRDLADFRTITEKQAAEFEESQTLRVFNAREHQLQQELRDAGTSAEKQNEVRNRLNELDAERRAFIEGNGRRIAAAIRSDTEHVIQFAQQIRDAFQRAADVRLEAGEANLEPLRNSILTRHQLWDAELQFEITREEDRHDRAAQGFRDEADLARIRIKNEQELAAVLAGIHAQEAAEAELHQARLKQLATQAAEQRRQELLQVADDLSSIASDIFDAIGKSSDEFWKSLKQSAVSFAKQIRDELFKGFLEKLITGQAQGAEGLIGAIINPLLGATGPKAEVADNTKATRANTLALNALTRTMGGSAGAPTDIAGGIDTALHELGGGISGRISNIFGGLFGGGRASGGPVDAGRVYQIHDNEFFRPNLTGKIYNLDQMSAVTGQSGGEVRTIVALGDEAVGEAINSHRLTPQGRRAQIVRGRWNRKTGGLQFA